MKEIFQHLKQFDKNQIQGILKELVPKKGKTKSEVARRLGISSQLLGQYMEGRHKPKPDFYVKWKEVFGENLLETNVSGEQVVFTKNVSKAISEAEERLIRMEASVTVLAVSLAQIVSNQSGKPIAEVAVELSKAIDQEAGRLFDELKRKHKS